ncbi:Receptor-like protein kinase THESEUS 1 [Glycine max]|nr:Receptor-like protein kinase THESEUS 1 [Glycine max]
MSKPKPIQVNHIVSTIGYIARESHRYGIVTDKTDVFSFGVVLLDVVWGRNYLYDIAGLHEASEEILEKCVIIANEIAEKPIEENGDPNIKGKIAPECWRVFIDIAKKCLKIEPPWEKGKGGRSTLEWHMLEQCFSNVLGTQVDPRNSIQQKLTNNFHQNRLIGYGGFSKVYKGCLQHNDASDYTWNTSEQLFKSEIELLCQLHHPNCVSLIGFCNHKNEKIIVYEYMSNGSLDRHLRGEDTEALPWNKRLEICIGAARGLHYLHAGAKRTIIHRDICVANILLNDDMEPKLAGFGHSIQGARFMSKPKPIKVNHYWGTCGYMALEHLREHIVTDKSDVYSFGIVLLKLSGEETFMAWQQEENLAENLLREKLILISKERLHQSVGKSL